MANHTCDTLSYVIDGKTIRLSFIKTTVSNIKVLSFSRKYGKETLKTVSGSGEYGINASWFANGGDNHIMNLAFQNGVRQGYFLSEDKVPTSGDLKLDGYTNTTGSSVIYCKSGKAYYSANVTSSTDSKIRNCTWVQGGLGLFLGHSDWREMFSVLPSLSRRIPTWPISWQHLIRLPLSSSEQLSCELSGLLTEREILTIRMRALSCLMVAVLHSCWAAL